MKFKDLQFKGVFSSHNPYQNLGAHPGGRLDTGSTVGAASAGRAVSDHEFLELLEAKLHELEETAPVMAGQMMLRRG